MEKLNKIEMEVENSIELLKIMKENDIKEIPEDGEIYWFYDRDCECVSSATWTDASWDKTRLYAGVVFKTESEARKYARNFSEKGLKQKIKRKILRAKKRYVSTNNRFWKEVYKMKVLMLEDLLKE